MTTKLTKPVRRQAAIVLDNRREPRERDQYIVTLHPNGTIGFRPKRARTEVIVTLGYCYQMALAQNALKKSKKGKKA